MRTRVLSRGTRLQQRRASESTRAPARAVKTAQNFWNPSGRRVRARTLTGMITIRPRPFVLVQVVLLVGSLHACASPEPTDRSPAPDYRGARAARAEDASRGGTADDSGTPTPPPPSPPEAPLDEDPSLAELIREYTIASPAEVSLITPCDEIAYRNSFRASDSRALRVCIHAIIAPGDAAGDVSDADAHDAINLLEEAFDGMLRFHLVALEHETSTDADLAEDHVDAFVEAREDASCLNVFVVRTLAGGRWAGLGYFTWLAHPSIVVVRRALHSPTLPHEVGHWLDLYHTFEDAWGQEPADPEARCMVDDIERRCSEVTGDLLAETPADRRDCVTSAACSAVTCTDPDVHADHSLFMSYGAGCRRRFGAEGLQKALCTTVTLRSEQLEGSACGGCTMPPPPVCVDDRTSRTFALGTCDEVSGQCVFPQTDRDCPYGCRGAGECLGCVGSCDGRACGPDGCGGTCAPGCASDELCVAGACTYTCPYDGGCTHEGRSCLDDRRSLLCTANARHPSCLDYVIDSCRSTERCVGGFCVCAASCAGRECGDDSCGGSCGSCPTGRVCDGSGQCVCPAGQTDCGGRCAATGTACPTSGDTQCGAFAGEMTCTGDDVVCSTTLRTSGTCTPCGAASGLCTCSSSGRCVEAYVDLCTDVCFRDCIRIPVATGGALRIPNLGAYGRGDEISSVRLVNISQVVLHEHSAYGGRSVTLRGSCADLHARGMCDGRVCGTWTGGGNVGDQSSSVVVTP